MMKRLIISGLILISLMLWGLIGCGDTGSKAIARVGSDKITVDEFNEYFSRIRLSFPTAQEEYDKRRELLDTLVVTKLLVQAAYEKQIDKLNELARVVLDNKDKFLRDALYQKHIAKQATPTEAEIKDFYNHLEYKIRASHIVIENIDTAQAVFERVKNGENFEQLAFNYSIDPDAKRNKGDLGYFVWGSTVDGFQEAAFAMEPGEISPPVKSRFGYHIIKLVDKQTNELRGTYDEMREAIKTQLLNMKNMTLTEKYFEDLKAKYPVTVEKATCDYLMHKREEMYPPQLLKTLPKNDFDVEQLDRDEKELVLATWDGGQITVNEYLTQIRNFLRPDMRPDLDNYDSLAVVIFELKKPDLLSLEALREGLDNDEYYLNRMKLFKELNMADIMRNDSIPTGPEPDEGMIRKYYEDHLDEYTDPAKVHVFEILLNDEIKARKLAKEIRSLKAFKDKAMDLTLRPGRRSKSGDLGYIERKWYPEIFDLAIKTSVGAIGGPVVTNQKYSIFYVVDKIEPEVKDFLSVKREVVNKLKKEQKDESFANWVDERMKSTNIEINDDVLWSTIDMSKYSDQTGTGEN